ncbi:hypothetical protein M408DRAFT_167835 [Serendipita vermifera MAFF 305830]|uniref:C2H2-type domain-containing protein n=1 Tax=Serendipita vermifera MAFF 305830 TaxID=933852 RepID=A0A0C2XES6_SERVB|nr:hypothetical protein M408DRAFT_167835 [Serendipita vermifera MAFF 305830]
MHEFISLTEPQETRHPFFLLQGIAPPILSDQGFPQPDSSFHNGDCEDCFNCVKLYDELVEKYPELVMEEDGSLPNLAHAPGTTKGQGGTEDSSSVTLVQEAVASTSSPEANTTLVTSGSNTGRRKRYKCAICNRSYDRDQRARDCANKDLGLTPYVCGNRCGRTNCTKAYSHEVLLHEHLASKEKRVIPCQKCGRSVLKKNMARHRQQAGH